MATNIMDLQMFCGHQKENEKKRVIIMNPSFTYIFHTYIYIFYSLADRPTVKRFKEEMLINHRSLHKQKKNQTYVLKSSGKKRFLKHSFMSFEA